MSEYINEIHDDEIDVRMEDEELEVKKKEKSPAYWMWCAGNSTFVLLVQPVQKETNL